MELKTSAFPDTSWDERVEMGGGDIYQTTIYAKFQEDCLNMTTEYILFKDNNNIIAQLMMNKGARFSKYLDSVPNIIRRFFEKYFIVYTSIRCPIIFKKEREEEIFEVLINHFDTLGKTAYLVKDISFPTTFIDECIKDRFRDNKFKEDSWGTILLDLRLSEKELFNSFSKSTKKKIRKNDFTVKRASTKRDYEKVINVIQQMEIRKGIYCQSKEYYLILFKSMGENIKTLYIEKDDKVLATASFYKFGNKSARALVGHSDYCYENKMNSMYSVEWEIIKLAKRLGCEQYDFTSIRPKTKDIDQEGINFYKRRWGGEEIHYPYYSKEYSLWKKVFISLIIKLIKRRALKRQ